jgi:hypothetical protein
MNTQKVKLASPELEAARCDILAELNATRNELKAMTALMREHNEEIF